MNEPSVGDSVEDDYGDVVAQIVSIRTKTHRVVLTGRGAGAVCHSPSDYPDGWETDLIDVRGSYRINRAVAVFNCFSGARFRPRRLVLACGDGNYGLRAMRWSRWGGHVAAGRGLVYANDCNPNCAEGHFHSTPARVRLSRPRYCSKDDRWNYTRAYVYPRGERRTHVSLGWICRNL